MDILPIAKSLVKALRRNDIEILGLLRKFRDVVVRTGTGAATQHFARKERDIVAEAQILDDVVINTFYLAWPVTISGIGFTLVEYNALDDTVCLCRFSIKRP